MGKVGCFGNRTVVQADVKATLSELVPPGTKIASLGSGDNDLNAVIGKERLEVGWATVSSTNCHVGLF
jgi:hypothetical protein